MNNVGRDKRLLGALVICICSYDPVVCRPPQHHQPISVRISETEFNSKYYKVSSGKVLVLNNQKFRVPGVELADREGSDVDASTISQRFLGLGFEYDLETDLTQVETLDCFKRGKLLIEQKINNSVQ